MTKYLRNRFWRVMIDEWLRVAAPLEISKHNVRASKAICFVQADGAALEA
jgi:hypothetical protein